MGVRDREADVLRACLDLLALAGIPAWRNNAGAIRTGKHLIRLAPAGTPDILGVLAGGRLLAIETKRKKGRVRPAQKEWIRRMQARGVMCLLVNDISDLEAWLKEGGYLK